MEANRYSQVDTPNKFGTEKADFNNTLSETELTTHGLNDVLSETCSRPGKRDGSNDMLPETTSAKQSKKTNSDDVTETMSEKQSKKTDLNDSTEIVSAKHLSQTTNSDVTETTNSDVTETTDSNDVTETASTKAREKADLDSRHDKITGKTMSTRREKKVLIKPDPIPGRCQFYVDRKRRYCKAPPSSGMLYCVEHAYLMGDKCILNRIPCPLDPKHSCYASHLEKHLKRCNARDGAKPACFVRNINAGDDEGADPALYKVGLRKVDEQEVLKMVDIVNKLHQEHVPELREDITFHSVLKADAENPDNGAPAQKHIQQQASLVGHMEKLGLLEDHCNYVEFGAGKGGLSHWVQLAMTSASDTQYLLVEKSGIRYKMDNYHKGEDQGPSFERIRLDIEHLDLGKVVSLQQSSNPVVGMGKHLCGGATDLMLRCLMETLHCNSESKCTSRVKGLVLALCCHHRCDWKTYVGKEFIKRCGLTPRDFHLVCSMTSWATCASDHVQTEQGKSDGLGEIDAETEYCHPRYGSLLPQEREKIGERCKQLIDMGRVDYLRRSEFNAEIVQYISRQQTLENVALLAKPVTDTLPDTTMKGDS